MFNIMNHLQTTIILIGTLMISKVIYGEFANKRPIIGLLTMQVYDEVMLENHPEMFEKSFVYASYVKFIEGGGAQVVPIFDNAPHEEVKRIFKQINGIVFPGSLVSLNESTYAKQARYLYKLAVESNKKGDYFPVLGVCRGFQLLPLVTDGRRPDDILIASNQSHDVSLAVKMTKYGKEKSRMLRDIPKDVLYDAEHYNIAAHFHFFSIPPKFFETNEKLRKQYTLVGSSTDSDGIESAAMFEDRKYPFYGLQFHPEKVLYEWNPKINVNHGKKAVRFAHYLSEFFIAECRKNHNKFSSLYEENRALIYNYQPIFVGVNTTYGPPFTQMFVF